MTAETSRDVFDAAQRGNVDADTVFRTMGTYLGITLAGIANLLNPEMFVICGGVTQGWEAFSGYISDEIRRRAYPAAAERAKLVRGELGDNAGILGTARSAFLGLRG
jgi:glucokinase